MDTTMRPVSFDGHFGWLHSAQTGDPGDAGWGVVLCNSLGHEALWLHQTMRQLAERLASRRIPVLRFDYAGTGDSLDRDTLVEPTQWTGEAVSAVEHLRRMMRVQRIALVGARYGAMVAAQAAPQVGAQRVVLMAPVVSGRQFVRELKVLQQTWREKTGSHVQTDAPPAGAFDVLGHRFDLAAMEQVAKHDLRRVQAPPAASVLIMHVDPHDPSHAIADVYRSQGARVDAGLFAEYPGAMQPSWLAEVPQATLDAVTQWLVNEEVTPQTVPAGASCPASPMLVCAGAPLQTDWMVEQPVKLDQGRLFGILCEPADRLGRAPLIVIPNTAATHHVGDGRFNVELARQLARAGFASLRLDASGLGDSAAAATQTDPGSLSFDALAADTSDAVDWACSRGHPGIAVFGICSGAYLGLRAALDNAAIRGLILANLFGFSFPDGFTMHDAGRVGAGSTRAHFRSMWRAQKWAQVLRGEVSLWPVIGTLCRYAVARTRSLAAAWTQDMRDTPGSSQRVRRQMKELAARGVRVQLLFSPLDHGLDELEVHFGHGGQRLARIGGAHARVIPNMDHEVLNPAARERVAALCEVFLTELFADVLDERQACPSLHAELARASYAHAHVPAATPTLPSEEAML
ncbi:alpha/beta hydrolase [Mycetohabitans endofungorum]|uniref:alpha/beta hydrolase n=1 Tax=Mycetohabitans endofungorum TaxID=417203 RepID=UPI002B054DD9|nr:alpha/beta hydrolase [Mycetohabitans endofungorum]